MNAFLVPTLALVNPRAVTVYWYVVRGSGFVLYLLLSLSVILGLLMALRCRSDAWPRVITEELHRYILLVAGIFLVIHVGTTLLDSFIHLSIGQVLIPFTSTYRTIWMSAGIVSMYLAAALFLSIYTRRFIGYKAWRTMHYAGSFAWILALTHSVTSGSDTRTPWALGIYGGTALIVTLLLAVRFGGLPVPLGQRGPLRPKVLWSLSGAFLLGTLLIESGPLASHWASRAGGTPALAAVPPIATASLPPVSFTDALAGSYTQETPGSLQQGTALLHLRLRGNGSYPVTLSYGLLLQPMEGGAQFVRGVFSLSPSSLAWNCSGPVTFHAPDLLASSCSPPGRSSMRLSVRFRLDGAGRVTGQIRAGSAARSPSSSGTSGA